MVFVGLKSRPSGCSISAIKIKKSNKTVAKIINPRCPAEGNFFRKIKFIDPVSFIHTTKFKHCVQSSIFTLMVKLWTGVWKLKPTLVVGLIGLVIVSDGGVREDVAINAPLLSLPPWDLIAIRRREKESLFNKRLIFIGLNFSKSHI